MAASYDATGNDIISTYATKKDLETTTNSSGDLTNKVIDGVFKGKTGFRYALGWTANAQNETPHIGTFIFASENAQAVPKRIPWYRAANNPDKAPNPTATIPVCDPVWRYDAANKNYADTKLKDVSNPSSAGLVYRAAGTGITPKTIGIEQTSTSNFDTTIPQRTSTGGIRSNYTFGESDYGLVNEKGMRQYVSEHAGGIKWYLHTLICDNALPDNYFLFVYFLSKRSSKFTSSLSPLGQTILGMMHTEGEFILIDAESNAGDYLFTSGGITFADNSQVTFSGYYYFTNKAYSFTTTSNMRLAAYQVRELIN